MFQVPVSVEDFPEIAENLEFRSIEYDLPNDKLDDWRCTVQVNSQASVFR